MDDAVKRFDERIKEGISGNLPSMLKGYAGKWAGSIALHANNLFLQTLEEEAPGFVEMVDADPTAYPGLAALFARAREERT